MAKEIAIDKIRKYHKLFIDKFMGKTVKLLSQLIDVESQGARYPNWRKTFNFDVRVHDEQWYRPSASYPSTEVYISPTNRNIVNNEYDLYITTYEELLTAADWPFRDVYASLISKHYSIRKSHKEEPLEESVDLIQLYKNFANKYLYKELKVTKPIRLYYESENPYSEDSVLVPVGDKIRLIEIFSFLGVDNVSYQNEAFFFDWQDLINSTDNIFKDLLKNQLSKPGPGSYKEEPLDESDSRINKELTDYYELFLRKYGGKTVRIITPIDASDDDWHHFTRLSGDVTVSDVMGSPMTPMYPTIIVRRDGRSYLVNMYDLLRSSDWPGREAFDQILAPRRTMRVYHSEDPIEESFKSIVEDIEGVLEQYQKLFINKFKGKEVKLIKPLKLHQKDGWGQREFSGSLIVDAHQINMPDYSFSNIVVSPVNERYDKYIVTYNDLLPVVDWNFREVYTKELEKYRNYGSGKTYKEDPLEESDKTNNIVKSFVRKYNGKEVIVTKPVRTNMFPAIDLPVGTKLKIINADYPICVVTYEDEYGESHTTYIGVFNLIPSTDNIFQHAFSRKPLKLGYEEEPLGESWKLK